MDKLEEVKMEVNKIIKSLYRKDGRYVNMQKLIKYGLDKQAINWGDLKAFEVWKNKKGDYLVSIDEASPDCPEFHAYISEEMQKKGFEVEVVTEW